MYKHKLLFNYTTAAEANEHGAVAYLKFSGDTTFISTATRSELEANPKMLHCIATRAAEEEYEYMGDVVGVEVVGLE